MQNFNIEYLTTDGGYIFTSMGASTTEELIEMVLERKTHAGDIPIMVLALKEPGVMKSFKLINSTRFNDV